MPCSQIDWCSTNCLQVFGRRCEQLRAVLFTNKIENDFPKPLNLPLKRNVRNAAEIIVERHETQREKCWDVSYNWFTLTFVFDPYVDSNVWELMEFS